MFTGIIEEIGTVRSVVSGARSCEIFITAKKVLDGTRVGDSIAVNGVCLTVTSMSGGSFTADVMPETLSRTNLGRLRTGDRVNLERAMAADGRFGGHIVTGHIDAVGEIASATRDDNAVRVRVKAPKHVLDLIIGKGSVCIDGISLTVTDVSDADFGVSVIPHTAKETTLLDKRPGDRVNLENDVIGKYVRRLTELSGAAAATKRDTSKSGITLEFLEQNGF